MNACINQHSKGLGFSFITVVIYQLNCLAIQAVRSRILLGLEMDSADPLDVTFLSLLVVLMDIGRMNQIMKSAKQSVSVIWHVQGQLYLMEHTITLTDAMCTELYRLKLVGIHICIIPLIYIQVQGTMEWIATESKVGFILHLGVFSDLSVVQ